MALRGVDALLDELEKAKVGLKTVDKNIAKLTGRDPAEPRPSPSSFRGRPRPSPRGLDDGRGRGRIFAHARRSLGEDDGGPPAKRRSSGGAFSRLGPRVVASRLEPQHGMDSGDEDPFSEKPAVQSSVVSHLPVVRSREDVSEDLNKDKESKGRNRRMFGALLGTLQRFKDEEKTKEDKEQMRKAVEHKLEQKARTEVAEARQERRKLFDERQKKEVKIKALEQKMELVKIHEQWAEQTHILGNFIRTKAKPHIYYIPKRQITATKDRLRQTKDLLEKAIKDRRKALEEEIAELTKEEEENMDVEHTRPRKESSRRSDHRRSKDNITVKITLEQPEELEAEQGEDRDGDEGDKDKAGEDQEEADRGSDTEADHLENKENREEPGDGEGEIEGVSNTEQESVSVSNGVQKQREVDEGRQDGDMEVDDGGPQEVNEDAPVERKSRKRSHSRRDSEGHHRSSRSRKDSKGHSEHSQREGEVAGGSDSPRNSQEVADTTEGEAQGDNRTVVSGEVEQEQCEADSRTAEIAESGSDTRLVQEGKSPDDDQEAAPF